MDYVHKRKELMEHIVDGIVEVKKYNPDNWREELHHHLFFTDYYIYGTYKAQQWLGDYAFDAIKIVKEYEQDNFGEVHTDFSEPEQVVNMYTYIAGEFLIQEMSLEEQNA
jgi:hypothetical protein